MNPVQHKNRLEQIKFVIPYLNFPVKEIITNWIDELLGLAAALLTPSKKRDLWITEWYWIGKAMAELKSLGKRCNEKRCYLIGSFHWSG